MENVHRQIPCIKIRVGGRYYHMPLEDMEKIVPWPKIQRVPGAPVGIQGISFESGKVIVYLSLEENGRAGDMSENCCGILMKTEKGSIVGVAADQLCEEVQLDREELDEEKERIAMQWYQLFGGDGS